MKGNNFFKNIIFDEILDMFQKLVNFKLFSIYTIFINFSYF